MPSNNSVTIIELKGAESKDSLYFQPYALPTELPGQGVRKRVLNSCARSESSPGRRFRAPGPIILGSRRASFVGGNAKFIESDAVADAREFEVSGGCRPKGDSHK